MTTMTRPHTEHAENDEAARMLCITDPRDGTPVGEVAVSADAEVAAALEQAARAFTEWRRVSPAQRGLALRAAGRRLAAHAEELAALTERETGKPYQQALGGVNAGADTLLQYAELAPVHRGKSLRGAGTAMDYTVDQPRGVVVVLTPWNDPVAVAAGLIGAAVVTGNTVVHKPSERCPHLGARLGEILAPAFPDGVLSTVQGDGAVGAALVTGRGVAAVAHVGSSDAGRNIARAAAGTGVHVIRENGGNDVLIVDADVDPAWAASQAALGAFLNSGQICTSVERVVVLRDIADAFIGHLVEEANALNASGALGPMVDERMRRAVHAQVRQAVEAGARALVGGAIPDGAGSHYPATVLVDCDPAMEVLRSETFGPVAPVVVVDSFDESVRLAADDRYGLAATVLTASIAHAARAADELPVGTVKVNAVFGGAPGGAAEPRGDSGSGFGYGPELLDEMTFTKVVHIEPAPPASAAS
ncbi:aldehyde dehydrogenase family protein [Cryobacterium tepidiphilum]|uniref:Aldehyde dehydrogenase family protein n=1 Tax=Cryobacterium tepidiphilum TaxID=2486026 RepID=A0A3M8LMD6_9MICO|nr:aldehyde dehydrogenase family protein [Cryobacterium tepidiphilum]RNE66525.1 aldehyde dehydrogenase family protein [Cryobacterium tepidiphilum]